mmetsp:Transcript_34402/g.101132  ORF Transcript_34402/g.101132 Transcript_34402/m.101132 type:complete len:233 (-) Transcript_34402:1341-2039(-)
MDVSAPDCAFELISTSDALAASERETFFSSSFLPAGNLSLTCPSEISVRASDCAAIESVPTSSVTLGGSVRVASFLSPSADEVLSTCPPGEAPGRSIGGCFFAFKTAFIASLCVGAVASASSAAASRASREPATELADPAPPISFGVASRSLSASDEVKMPSLSLSSPSPVMISLGCWEAPGFGSFAIVVELVWYSRQSFPSLMSEATPLPVLSASFASSFFSSLVVLSSPE